MKLKLNFPYFNDFFSRNRLRDLYRNCCVKRFFFITEIEWGEHRSEQPRQESFDRWKTKLRSRHGGGRTCRQKIEDLRGSSSIRGVLRVSGPTQSWGHQLHYSVCHSCSQSRSSSCSLNLLCASSKNRKKNDIYIINIQPKNTRKERIQWKHLNNIRNTKNKSSILFCKNYERKKKISYFFDWIFKLLFELFSTSKKLVLLIL